MKYWVSPTRKTQQLHIELRVHQLFVSQRGRGAGLSSQLHTESISQQGGLQRTASILDGAHDPPAVDRAPC